jgi:hypothetical protein
MNFMNRRDFLKASACLSIAAVFPQAFASRRVDTKIAYKFSDLADLYCFMRKEIAGYSKLDSKWNEPLENMRKAERMEPPRLGFALLDGFIADSAGLRDLGRSFWDAPEKVSEDVPVQEPLVYVYRALRKAMPIYEADIRDDHKKVVQAAQERIDKELTPNADKVVGFILDSLQLEDSGGTVPVFLTAAGPPPGGFTSRSRETSAACFIAVEGFAGSLLYEVILHESTHAFEVLAADANPSVLDLLRRELASRGVSEKDPKYRDVPHTLMFVQSAETVKRFINPQHIPYGEVLGYYKRIGKIADSVQRHWLLHLDGHVDVPTTVRHIVDDVLG